MKRGLCLLTITMFLFLFGLVSSQSCSIADRSSCPNVVMGLANTTNTHGELENQSNYNTALCCDFAGSTTCSGLNKIIGLSSVTNAHAEIVTETTYVNDVCYADLECISTSLDCANTAYTMEIFSLSDFTNAHIGGINDYSINVCCRTSGGGGGGTPDAYWESQITEVNVSVGNTIIQLILDDSGLSEGTAVTFEIWEDDWIRNDDIRTTALGNALTGTVDASGRAVADWTVTQADLDRTTDYGEFFFMVNGAQSGDLSITIIAEEELNCNGVITCLDYSDSSPCDFDTCGVASDTTPENVDCDDPSIDCSCLWNAGTGACDSTFTEYNETTGGEIGTCTYTSITNDTCDDGFLSSSWTASWSGTGPSPPDCVDGSETFECPAQIQLPFFGIQSLIVTALIIAMIYVILISRGRKPRSKKLIKRKRKA